MIQTPVEFLQEALRIHFTHEQEMQFEGLFQQAKEMFDQQMIEFAEFVDKYPDKNRNFKGEILHAKSKYDESERTIDLLKTYLSKESDDDNSQTEISDEDIEKGAKDWYAKHDSYKPSAIALKTWVYAIKWYKEQLNSR